VPYINQGVMYLVSLGHITIGLNREFADWRVIFQSLEDGKLEQRAAFAVGMWKGDLKSASTIP